MSGGLYLTALPSRLVNTRRSSDGSPSASVVDGDGDALGLGLRPHFVGGLLRQRGEIDFAERPRIDRFGLFQPGKVVGQVQGVLGVAADALKTAILVVAAGGTLDEGDDRYQHRADVVRDEAHHVLARLLRQTLPFGGGANDGDAVIERIEAGLGGGGGRVGVAQQAQFIVHEALGRFEPPPAPQRISQRGAEQDGAWRQPGLTPAQLEHADGDGGEADAGRPGKAGAR